MRRRVAGATAEAKLPGLLVSYTTLDVGYSKVRLLRTRRAERRIEDVSGGCDWRQESGRGISKERAKSVLSSSLRTSPTAIATRFERFHYDRTRPLESHNSLSSGLTSMSLDRTLKAKEK